MNADAIPLLRATHLKPFLAAMKLVGAPVEKLMRQARLPLLAHEDADAVVPELFAWDLVGRVARTEGIEDFGIVAATNMPAWRSEPELMRVLEGSTTLWSGLHTFCQLVRHISTGVQYSITRASEHALFSRGKRPGTFGEDQVELYGLMMLVQLIQLAAGRAWWPTDIVIGESNARRLDAFNGIGAAHVHISETYTGILVPANLLALRMRPALLSDPDSLTGPLADDFLGSLRSALGGYLRDGKPSIALAAEMAGLSERTFQRRLAHAQLNYSTLLDQVRFAKAEPPLRQRDVTITDIAYDLGFSDVAHFTRAFRRWTGLSPREYRRQQQAA